MFPRWDERAADDARRRWSASGGEALATLVYASRLLGSDRGLVLAGGGNTSLKTGGSDPAGRALDVLWVKGSGVDLDGIGPDGFAPLDLGRLAPLAALPVVGDDALMALLGLSRLDPRAPFPSVETLLHAFVPAPAIVHTHADAVLVLAGLPDPAPLAAALGPAIAVRPFVRPGHGLAMVARAALEADPGLEGILFRHHGLFTWGATPREATERMLGAVARCAAALEALGAPLAVPADGPAVDRDAAERAAQLAPRLRRALAASGHAVVVFRGGPGVRALVDAPGLAARAARGPLTPDHALRTGRGPLVLAPDEAVGDALAARVAEFAAGYRAYAARAGGGTGPGEDLPRVVLVPGTGLFAAGPTLRGAQAAADVATRTLAALAAAERAGGFEPLDERALYETEFWPPEREKLRRAPRGELAGRVALVTGAAGAIGAGVAAALARAGAVVALADRPGAEHEPRLAQARDAVLARVPGAEVLDLPFDVTDPAAVEGAFRALALRCGGADLLVLSHGTALVGGIDALDPARLRAVFDINALGSFAVLGAFVRQVRARGAGGDVVLLSTKNVPDPGASFAAYSASKAAAHQLARVAAIELAPLDIRVNMVAPDAVFGDAATPSLLWQTVGTERAKSKGIDPATLPEQYRQRNLLKERVTADDVAEAVLFFAARRTPTTGAVLPVDGGLPGAFPR